MTENDKQRLKLVLEAYGADPARWPEADRHLAAAAGSPGLRRAKAIDAVLTAATAPQAPAGLASRIAASAVAQTSNVVAFAPRSARKLPYWPAAAALAASLAIGIYLGATSPGDMFFPATGTAALDDPLGLMNFDQSDETSLGDSV